MISCSNPLAQFHSHDSEITQAIRDVLESGSYILGPKLAEFEKKLSAYCGANFAVGVNSGTDAIVLSLKALNIGPGDEVITVAHTAIATISAIIAVGATPVLVDIDAEYWTIDSYSIESAITGKTKAIIAVHIYGQSIDIKEILRITKQHSLYLIEDCAQSVGTMFDGKVVGSFGDFGCFSFYPTKNLGAIGDGGMVVTNDQFLAERVRRIRQYGWNQQRQTCEVGINSRLDEIQAAILLTKLKYLDEDNHKRNVIANQYLTKIKNQKFILPRVRLNSFHSFHLFPVLCETRDDAIAALGQKLINVGVHYYPACHEAEGYKDKIRIGASGLNVTEKISEKVMSLPMYPELATSDIEEIIAAINSY